MEEKIQDNVVPRASFPLLKVINIIFGALLIVLSLNIKLPLIDNIPTGYLFLAAGIVLLLNSFMSGGHSKVRRFRKNLAKELER